MTVSVASSSIISGSFDLLRASLPELAFGSSVVSQIDEDQDPVMENKTDAKEVKPVGRWFGFRSNATKGESSVASTADSAAPSPKMARKNNDGGRTRRKQPLNIAPTKLDGIRHAVRMIGLRQRLSKSRTANLVLIITRDQWSIRLMTGLRKIRISCLRLLWSCSCHPA